MIPWEEFEEEYASNFTGAITGEEAFNVRVALGSLIIKERLGISDRDVVKQIAENSYLQYFLGFDGYKIGEPFAASLLTHFRKRFSADVLSRVNEAVIQAEEKDDKGPAFESRMAHQRLFA